MHRCFRTFAALVLLTAMALLAPAVPARAQIVCDRLLPMGLLPPPTGFTFGCSHQFNLKLGAAIGPDGNYILISYPSCATGTCAGQTGTALLQCAAANGYFCCVQVSQIFPTITGTNVGTLATGLNQRIASDTDTRAGICYAAYAGNGARVANVPVIEFPGGDRTMAQIDGFLQVFIVGPPTGTGTSTTIPVEFLSDPTPTVSSSWGRVKMLYR